MAQLKISGAVKFTGGVFWKKPPYIIDQSLRGNRWTNQYLYKTYTASERKTFSISLWVQRSSIGYEQIILQAFAGSGFATALTFYTNNRLRFVHQVSSLQIDNAVDIELTDSNGWYHILFVYDTTQSFRYKAYINGVEGDWIVNPASLSANYETYINSAVNHFWGVNAFDSSSRFAGVFSDIHFFDGIAADINDFGYFDKNDVWQPLEYSGSYGTNGCNLNFSNVSNLGEDSSGNENDHTEVGYSTLGNAFWQIPVSPTVNNKNNTAKHDASQTYAYNYLSRGGFSVNSNSEGNWRSAWSTIGFDGVSGGKWYWECKRTHYSTIKTGIIVGVAPPTFFWSANYVGQLANSYGLQPYTGSDARLYENSSPTTLSNFGDVTLDDVIMIAFDADNGNIWFGYNGTWYNSGDPANGTNPTETGLPSEMIPVNSSAYSTDVIDIITHEDDLNYTVPTGFKSLMHKNLVTQNILDGEEHFDAITYTGTGEVQSITGLKFQPDFIWIKCRNNITTDHVLTDSSRGVTKQLWSSLSSAEQTDVNMITSFDSEGFSLGDNSTGIGSVNESTYTYVAWCWKAGSGSVSNTDGTITSNVNANTKAGFSIITYTGNGTSGATIGHGLGATPAFILIKDRDNGNSWAVFHRWMDETSPENYFMNLNDTDAAATDTSIWNDTTPTSSVFSIGNNSSVNTTSVNYIAYVWTDIPGYSKFGTYTGLGDPAAGAGIHTNTGFKPAFFMAKSESNIGSWVIHDNERDLVNTGINALFAETNGIEQNTWGHEFVSNGVKINTSNTNINGINRRYVYASFGKTPQRIARGGRR